MKILVGRDKLDQVQGVRHKIQAFEYFLDKYPHFQGKVVLIQVALQTTESNELAGGVPDLVSRVNSRFSTLTYQPVVFLHTQDLTFTQYIALLSVADAFIVTSLREGMALRTHEFVECQEGRWRPLVLSEVGHPFSLSGEGLWFGSLRARIAIVDLGLVSRLIHMIPEGLLLLSTRCAYFVPVYTHTTDGRITGSYDERQRSFFSMGGTTPRASFLCLS
jgi:hypothetical protein